MIARHRIRLCAAAALALVAVQAGVAEAAPLPKQKPAAKQLKVKTDTRVYLLRGLLNVFSLGMDALGERLTDMGIEAEVSNHNGWIAIASKIAEDRKRGNKGAVVLIGHSLGADVLFQLTERLEKDNVEVRLAVFFDPTISHDISKNVEHVLNLYQLNGFGRKVTAPKGYKGELVNMDLSSDESIGHGSIDKSQKLHDLVVAKIMKVAVGPVPRPRKGPAKPPPVAAVQAPRVSPAASPASPPADVAPAVPHSAAVPSEKPARAEDAPATPAPALKPAADAPRI